MRTCIVFLMACWISLLLPLSQAGAATDYRGPAPAWVKVHQLPEVKQNRVSQTTGGIYYLMLDDQVRWTPDVQVFHRRFAYKVIDRLGLEEGARVTVEFDPTHEEVTFHSISIRREGRVLDRFAGARIKTYQREKQLSSGIVDGHLTAHVDIPDVRVGDLVEYEFSIASRPELALNEFSQTVRMHWTVPVGLHRYRVSLPDNKRLQVRNFGLDLSPVISKTGSEVIHEWIVEDADPIPAEADVPSWNLSGSVQVSTFETWDSISRVLLPHYSSMQTLPADFAGKVDKIAGRFASENDRITETLRLVQDSIRYVGIEIGPGALIPRKPELTVSRGYGDCKDKSMLLIAALRRMNIEAVPALVNLKNGIDLADRLPSLGAFDHLIVRVENGGKVYWLDPTVSHQGGRIPEVAAPAYGYALPVTAATSTLEKIALAESDQPTVKLTETFAFPATDGEKLKLHSRTIYLGADADYFRYSLVSRGKTDVARAYFDFYSKLYPGIKSATPISITDNRDQNRIVVEEYYDLEWAELNKNDLVRKFPLSASNLSGALKRPNPGGRQLPVVLSYPLYRQHSINVLGLKAQYQPPADVIRNTETLRFELNSQAYWDSLHLSWELETKQSEVPGDGVKEYAEIASEINNISYWTYDFLYVPDIEPGWVEWATLSVMFLLFGVPLVCGAVFGIRADRKYADKGVYFPVSLTKFTVMSLVTFGFYPFFWMFKHWQWCNRVEAARVWPYVRAVFAMLWLYPAFNAARQRLGKNAPSYLFGVAGILIYAAGTVGNIYMVNDWTGFAMLVCSIPGFYPAVVTVNRLNGPDPHALVRNSRFNRWNVVGIVIGGLMWAFFLFILFADYFAPELLSEFH